MEEGVLRPREAPSRQSLSLSCSHLTATLSDAHVPSNQSLLKLDPVGCSLGPQTSSGAWRGAFLGQESPHRVPSSHWKEGVTLAWRHRGPSALRPLSLPGSVLHFFPPCETRVPESQGFGEPLKRQWGQREGRWYPFPQMWLDTVHGAQSSWGVVLPERWAECYYIT